MTDSIEDIYCRDGRRVFSTLVRLLGNMDAAEEALHDAFVAAAEQWPTQGVPANPRAWLVSVGRFKAIDKIRRQSRFVSIDAAPAVADAAAAVPDEQAPRWEQQWDARQDIEDDRLRLIFTCCHPSLAEEARIALTLREVCGLPTFQGGALPDAARHRAAARELRGDDHDFALAECARSRAAA